MLGLQWKAFVKRLVHGEWVIEIDRIAEEHFLPKIADDGEVVIKIEFVKVMADLGIVDNDLVELDQEPVDIRPRFDVALHYSVEISASS